MRTALRRVRTLQGWSQADVAKQLGITVQAYSLIETGKRDPSYEVLVALEDVFHTSHRRLLREE
jgi:transcriptional regulator with XRE-family HTH domain|nr:MAG TPA: Helix-turn-helix XRE-family like protein [Caudoviricetes sp.]